MIWSGNGWTIVQGNAIRVLEEYQGEKFAGMITDPPYSSGGATRGDRTVQPNQKYCLGGSGNRELPAFAGDARDQRSFALWCSLWMESALRNAEPGAVGLVFTDWRQLPTMTDAVQAGGWVWRGIVPWDKGVGARPQLGRPRAQCEYGIFATAGPHKPWDGAPAVPGFYTEAAPRNRIHITEKPASLIRSMASLVRPGGLVLDPFVGSGAHGVGVVQAGRRYFGVEIVPEIAERAAARLQAMDRGQSLDEFEAWQGSLFSG